jgi:hypothetical protein
MACVERVCEACAGWTAGVPHSAQNLAVPDKSAPQCAHLRASAAPHSSQNFAPVLTEDRFAISTGPAHKATAVNVERRYRLLRRTIQKTYLNSIVRWRNPNVPGAPAGPSRSANPSKPDPSLWVGPAAMNWLAGDAARRIKQFLAGYVEGVPGGFRTPASSLAQPLSLADIRNPSQKEKRANA